ncbi:MAG: hypothetical protein IJH34_14415, partial [Romboutsia sp.]|nr:hypothetical protein [Romboutsia sp.]
MKKIISFLKPYTFRFCDVLTIINRPLCISLLNYVFMVFILSFLYHFETGLHLSLSASILNFLKSFAIEILSS